MTRRILGTPLKLIDQCAEGGKLDMSQNEGFDAFL